MKLNQTFKNIKRLRQIALVFARHGFRQVIEEIGLDRLANFKVPEEGEKRLSMPVRLRKAFEELGPTFVKLGQMLSIRPDLIPREFVEEFRKLQDNVTGLDFPVIRQRVEEAFDAPLDKLFSEFDEKPVGAASIAQVHRAVLVDGGQVVVKVRRPGIRRQIETDLSILFILADLLERYFTALAVVNPTAIVDEFARTILEELNFIHEGQNIKRFHSNFEEDEYVVIPEVVWELTNRRVLTMSFLDGFPLREVERLDELEWNRRRLADIGMDAFFKMVFTDGFFHGDIHGGNILVLERDRIGLIDFGVTGTFDDRLLEEVASLFLSLITRDFRSLARNFLRMSTSGRKQVSPDAFSRDLQQVIEPIMGLELSQIDSAELLMSLAGVAQRHQVRIPHELLLLFRAIISMEALGRELDPEFDVISAASSYARTVIIDRYRPEKLLGDLITALRGLADLGRDMPGQMQTILKRAEEGSLGVDVHLNNDQTRRTLSRESWRIASSVLTAGGAIGLATIHSSPSFGMAGLVSLATFIAGGVGLGWLLITHHDRRS